MENVSFKFKLGANVYAFTIDGIQCLKITNIRVFKNRCANNILYCLDNGKYWYNENELFNNLNNCIKNTV